MHECICSGAGPDRRRVTYSHGDVRRDLRITADCFASLFGSGVLTPAGQQREGDGDGGGTGRRRCPLVTLQSGGRWAGPSRHLRCTVLRSQQHGSCAERRKRFSGFTENLLLQAGRLPYLGRTAGGNRRARATSFRRRRQGSKAVRGCGPLWSLLAASPGKCCSTAEEPLVHSRPQVSEVASVLLQCTWLG